MIAVDTSALMAIVLDEPLAPACIQGLARAERVLVSAGTLAEALIVAKNRGHGPSMQKLMDGFGFEIADVTAAFARQVAEAYARWGKGVHPAGLNLGDCFAYALAKGRKCPLLYVGSNFARTGISAVL